MMKVKNKLIYDDQKLDNFYHGINTLRESGLWGKKDIINLFYDLLPEFAHKETGKYLDDRM